MIEKYNEEQIRQILSELGISEKQYTRIIEKVKNERTEQLLSKQISELETLLAGKPKLKSSCSKGKVYECINTIISMTINNVVRVRYDGKSKYWKVSGSVNFDDKDEFKEMFNEILEIIKKHNRQWESDNK